MHIHHHVTMPCASPVCSGLRPANPSTFSRLTRTVLLPATTRIVPPLLSNMSSSLRSLSHTNQTATRPYGCSWRCSRHQRPIYPTRFNSYKTHHEEHRRSILSVSDHLHQPSHLLFPHQRQPRPHLLNADVSSPTAPPQLVVQRMPKCALQLHLFYFNCHLSRKSDLNLETSRTENGAQHNNSGTTNTGPLQSSVSTPR